MEKWIKKQKQYRFKIKLSGNFTFKNPYKKSNTELNNQFIFKKISNKAQCKMTTDIKNDKAIETGI